MPMALLRRMGTVRSSVGGLARAAVGTAVTGAGLAAAPAVLTAGLLKEPSRVAAELARAAAGGTVAVAGESLHLAKRAALGGTRAVGTVLTGADPIPDGHVRH